VTKQTFTVGQVLTAAQMTSLQQTAMGGGSTTAKTASYVLVAADAGTVVQMNAAGATTITVNTALFAAGDSVQIQNVGAGVCTVTAGTATVSTSATLALKQYDAGTLYFNTTSAAIFFAVDAADGMANVLTTTGDIIYSSSGTTAARLGIGSTSQVLTVTGGVPVWATAAAGGWALITSGSLSSTSTTVSSISGAYTDLRILFRAHRSSTDAAGLYITYNSTDTIYNPSVAFNSTSSDTFGYANAASTANLVAGNVDNTVYADNTTIIQMPGYSNSSLQKSADVYGNTYRADNPNFNWIMYKSRIGLTAAITSFTISASAGNLSGSYYVYGI
jgi:hypothetical protein